MEPKEPTPRRDLPEPEILPPRSGEFAGRHDRRVWISISTAGSGDQARRARPFTFLIAAVAAVLAVALVLMLVLGIVLIWIPVIAAVVAGLLVARFVRGYLRQR